MKRTKKGKKRLVNAKELFGKLLTIGKKKGYLTYEEINDFLPEDIISADQIEKVFSYIACLLGIFASVIAAEQ